MARITTHPTPALWYPRALAWAAVALIASALPATGQPQSLVLAWESAWAREPTLQAAKASLEAAEERTAQAARALLPQLSATFSTNTYKRGYQTVQAAATTNSLQRFGATASALNLTQPIWRRANQSALAQAQDGQAQAQYQLEAVERDTAGRFITGWFDAMAARDAFAAPVLLASPEPPFLGVLDPLELWLTRAAAQNQAILAAEKALAAARQQISKQQAQKEPAVDLRGSFATHDQADAGNFPGQNGFKTKQLSLGVHVAMPLYSGGTQSAKVREAAALARKAEFDLDTADRATALKVKQAWAAARSAVVRGAAGGQGVTAAQAALRSALAGQRTGLKTALEELQARQLLAAAQRDQLRARYDQVVSIVKLRAAIGEDNGALIATLQLALADDKLPPRAP